MIAMTLTLADVTLALRKPASADQDARRKDRSQGVELDKRTK
jgi:hypothetical protein